MEILLRILSKLVAFLRDFRWVYLGLFVIAILTNVRDDTPPYEYIIKGGNMKTILKDMWAAADKNTSDKIYLEECGNLLECNSGLINQLTENENIQSITVGYKHKNEIVYLELQLEDDIIIHPLTVHPLNKEKHNLIQGYLYQIGQTLNDNICQLSIDFFSYYSFEKDILRKGKIQYEKMYFPKGCDVFRLVFLQKSSNFSLLLLFMVLGNFLIYAIMKYILIYSFGYGYEK